MKNPEKQAIRRRVRSDFPGQADRAEQSQSLCRHVLAWTAYRQARVVGGYMPMPWEADVTPVLVDALASGKTLVLPRCEGPGEMSFRQVSSLEEMRPGCYGLLEPDPGAAVVPVEKIELMLVPLEAITPKGVRLGKGGGYYDRIMTHFSGVTLGMVLQHQWVKDLPVEEWDHPLNAGADMLGIYLF